MATIDINGTTIYYEAGGAGPGVLFVHGMCGDAEVWRDQAERLGPGYRCVRYDRRGYSRSPRGDAPVSEMLHTDDAAALIRALDLEPCLVVGSSAGANVVVDLLSRYPRLLRGAVVSEPPLFSIAPDLGAALLHEVQQVVDTALAGAGPRAGVDAFMTHLCPGLWFELDEAHKDRYRSNAETGFADLRAPKANISAADLSEIDLPVIVVSGSASVPQHRELARILADSLARARFLELPECGHVTYAEQPELFADALRTFAGELDADRSVTH